MRTELQIVVVAAALVTLGLSADPARANSRFLVKNEGATEVLINIFDGDDTMCVSEAKHHTVGPGDERGMGCVGGGKQRCKVRVSTKQDGKWKQACMEQNNGCGDTTVILPNDATLVVPDGGTGCKVTTSE
jgi:hypothetical protein